MASSFKPFGTSITPTERRRRAERRRRRPDGVGGENVAGGVDVAGGGVSGAGGEGWAAGGVGRPSGRRRADKPYSMVGRPRRLASARLCWPATRRSRAARLG